MLPLARIFTASTTLDLSRFGIDGFRMQATPGLAYEPCDLAIIKGLANPLLSSSSARLRNDVFARHRGPVLVIESSIIGRIFAAPKGHWLKRLAGSYRKPDQISPYCRLAVGGAFGPEADFNNADSPPDRWKDLGIEVQPYRSSGDHILLIGQTPHDTSLRGVDITDWLCETARTIRQHSSRPILVRFHPGMGGWDAAAARTRLGKMPGVTVAPRNKPLSEHLDGAWVTVTLSSGAAIDSLIAGIPAITLSPDSLAYSICPRSVGEVDTPVMPPREQLLYDLAYAQWTHEEYRDGTAARHIAPAVWRAMNNARQAAE